MWPEREATQFGNYKFAPTCYDGLVLSTKKSSGGLGEDDGAVGIEERTKSYEGVREGWKDVAFGGGRRELWE